MQRKVKVAEYRSDLHLYDLESNSYPLANFQADIYNPLVAGWECYQCDQRSRSQGCVRRSRSASGHHHGLHRPGSGGSAASTTGDTNENKIFIFSYQLFFFVQGAGGKIVPQLVQQRLGQQVQMVPAGAAGPSQQSTVQVVQQLNTSGQVVHQV